MANANVTTLQARNKSAVRLQIRLTHRCRDMFVRSGLERKYLANFIRTCGTVVIYGMTLELAEELQTALVQLRSEAKHYDKTALAALERELKNVLFAERAKGLLPDPELDVSNVFMAYMLATTSSPARLNVGDRAIECHVGEVTITDPYGFYRICCDDGPFYDKQGTRIDYRWGYRVHVAGGDDLIAGNYIARVSDLYDVDGCPTYLRAVQSDDAAAPALGGDHD